jgi:hypothetical protein
MPTAFHDRPALIRKGWNTFWSQSSLYITPQLVFTLTSIISLWKLNTALADVPQENTKGININGIVISTTKQLRSHMDRSTNNRCTHHCLWFAEAKVSDLASIVFIQLQINQVAKTISKCSEREFTRTFLSLTSLWIRPWL